jgi:hypothetical protein
VVNGHMAHRDTDAERRAEVIRSAAETVRNTAVAVLAEIEEAG